jgi:cell division protein FtsQ
MRVSRNMSQAHRLLAAGLLASVLIAFVVVLFGMNGPVRVVRVSGDLTAAERIEVEAAVLRRLNGGLLGVQLDDVIESVLALTWPREVRARRVWPNGVDVSVTKDALVARWGDEGALNSAGEVIAAAGVPDSSLPMIRCVNASGARAMQIFQMLAQVLGDTPLKIGAVEENALGEWQVTFTNDLVVSLGREDLLKRIERFDRVFRNVIRDRLDQVDHVDARYSNGVAVNWHGASVASAVPQLASLSNGLGMSK